MKKEMVVKVKDVKKARAMIDIIMTQLAIEQAKTIIYKRYGVKMISPGIYKNLGKFRGE